MIIDIIEKDNPALLAELVTRLQINKSPVETYKLNQNECVSFYHILENELVSSVFQPIIDLKTMDVIGYEALSRGPEFTEWHSPVALIEEATRRGMLWKLELLFRKKAISSASELGISNLLFINVDPNVIHDAKFKEGLTRQVVLENGLKPSQIVFEITERSAIENHENFTTAIEHYKNQGYKIAIDDTGAGYSNLNAISHIRPGFIKIDMELIREIDHHTFKQAIVKSFVVLANLTGSKLIAEGVETMEEAKTLISIGVHMGQGYLFGRPSKTADKLTNELKTSLMVVVMSGMMMHAYNTRLIGEITETVPSVKSNTSCSEVKELLDMHAFEGVCVVENAVIIGHIMRNRLNERLSRQYGYSLYAKKPISKIMNRSSLVVEATTPISSVTEMALSRLGDSVYDNIIISNNGHYEGMVSVISLMRHAMEIERTYALELNPLTGLPGNVQINKVLLETIRSGIETGVLYFDLDNFKVYNDIYGFEQGDTIIKMLKDVLCTAIKTDHLCASFVGHIGGDDFIAVVTCSQDKCKAICDETIKMFDEKVMDLFHDEHRKAGFFDLRDKMDRIVRYPLTSLSIAAIYGKMDSFNSPEELAKKMASIKKKAKAVTGSCCVFEYVHESGNKQSEAIKNAT